jgi:hypothetical protein
VLIIAGPRARLTHRVLASLWPLALPALVHIAFILVILLVARPNILQLWHSLYLEHGLFGSTTVTLLSQLYGQFPEYATLHGWVHVVVGDIFMARWAYLDALERGVPNRGMAFVSALIAFFGPGRSNRPSDHSRAQRQHILIDTEVWRGSAQTGHNVTTLRRLQDDLHRRSTR